MTPRPLRGNTVPSAPSTCVVLACHGAHGLQPVWSGWAGQVVWRRAFARVA